MKETDVNRWEDISWLWIGRINIVKMSHYYNDLQIRCNTYQNTNDTLYRTREKNPKVSMEPQKSIK
jgi:hypothetical protein